MAPTNQESHTRPLIEGRALQKNPVHPKRNRRKNRYFREHTEVDPRNDLFSTGAVRRQISTAQVTEDRLQYLPVGENLCLRCGNMRTGCLL
ncbi:hypothetical protein JTB14_007175 [Gonioctena quinquepunctata]|nr:hypothetical protein JTB14_007175 [Gonioctena quinquepunctata]